MRRFAILALLTALVLPLMAQQRHTVAYREVEGKTLQLDHYPATSNVRANAEGKRPCVMFLFGGGFASGARDRERYMPYFEMLSREGCDVISIDYRLGLAQLAAQSAEERPKMGIRDAIAMMTRSVNYAAEDALHATAFVLERAEAWGIDPSRIVISGSSAGAIASLQAEYYICNASPLAQVLPRGFNYAGVIAFAGAIYSTSGAPRWRGTPCPMLLFHGTSDGNVPYAKASIFGIGMWGAASVVGWLERMDVPYHFYSVRYGTHALAETPMRDKHAEILAFIDEHVTRGSKTQRRSEVYDLAGEVRKERFSVRDYLTNNYSGK